MVILESAPKSFSFSVAIHTEMVKRYVLLIHAFLLQTIRKSPT